jgi:hypothetical protein
MKMQSTINNFFIEEDQRNRAREIIRQRRGLLDQQPITHSPVQIELVPSPPPNGASPMPPNTPDFPLTPLIEMQINPLSTGDRKL